MILSLVSLREENRKWLGGFLRNVAKVICNLASICPFIRKTQFSQNCPHLNDIVHLFSESMTQDSLKHTMRIIAIFEIRTINQSSFQDSLGHVTCSLVMRNHLVHEKRQRILVFDIVCHSHNHLTVNSFNTFCEVLENWIIIGYITNDVSWALRMGK